jgi:Fe-S cluster assembly protein SufD
MKKEIKKLVKNLQQPEVATLVFYNDKFEPKFSDSDFAGVEINSLRRSDHTFCDPTFFLNVPDQIKINKPIQLLFLTDKDCKLQLEITIGKNSSAMILEKYISPGDKKYNHKINLTFNLTEHSELQHYKCQTETSESAHTAITTINQNAHSKLNSFYIGRGGKTANEKLQINLAAPHAQYINTGFFQLCDEQAHDYQINIQHLVPNCSSKVLFKGIVANQASGNFVGKINVAPHATKTEAHLTNKNLLLSEQAKMQTKPQLEIYADDVICTHGATVGQLDQNALFYLRSRGIAQPDAINILVSAFIQEITDLIPKFILC